VRDNIPKREVQEDARIADPSNFLQERSYHTNRKKERKKKKKKKKIY
jgi:hypothetical protein